MDSTASNRLLAIFQGREPGHDSFATVLEQVMQTPSPLRTLLSAVMNSDPAAAKKAIIDDHASFTKYGELALTMAVYRDVDDVVNVLLSHGASVGEGAVLVLAAKKPGNIYIVSRLLQAGADPNAKGQQPLHAAIESADLDIIDALLSAGAKVDIHHISLCKTLKNDAAFALLGLYVTDPRLFDFDGVPLMTEEQYHGFFDTFCETANEHDTSTLRNLLLTTAYELKLSKADIQIVTSADTPSLCRWMRQKQSDRSEICTNDTDPVMWSNVRDIPLMFLYHLREGNKVFCYDIVTLGAAVLKSPINPLTNVALPRDMISDISKRYNKITSMMVSLVDLHGRSYDP